MMLPPMVLRPILSVPHQKEWLFPLSLSPAGLSTPLLPTTLPEAWSAGLVCLPGWSLSPRRQAGAHSSFTHSVGTEGPQRIELSFCLTHAQPLLVWSRLVSNLWISDQSHHSTFGPSMYASVNLSASLLLLTFDPLVS